MRKLIVLAALAASALVLAPAAHGSTTESKAVVIPVAHLSTVLPQLAAGGWSCTVGVNLATGQPATHYAYGVRSYFYSCTR